MVLSVCLCLYEDYVFEYAPIFNDFGIGALLHLRKPYIRKPFLKILWHMTFFEGQNCSSRF